ncbi:MAG: DUF554 domain-containing protein [Clostridia bacterium]|nr:DUF554 domain-containing protein [Clostridia bacterium]
MLGVTVNALAIVICSLVGMCLKKVLNDRVEKVLMQGLGVSVLIVGIIDAIKPVEGETGILVLIISIAVGALIGSILNIEKGFIFVGESFEKGFNKLFYKNGVPEGEKGKFSEGFIQATMIYCIGAMVIYGSIQAGLGDNKTLYVKAVLDGTLALILSVKYGFGITCAAIPVFILQGLIALLSSFLGEFLLQETLFRQELSAIGGVFVMMIGFNLLEIKKFNIANMIPELLGAGYYIIF